MKSNLPNCQIKITVNISASTAHLFWYLKTMHCTCMCYSVCGINDTMPTVMI